MKSQAQHPDRKTAEKQCCSARAVVAANRWPWSGIPATQHNDDGPQGVDELRIISRRGLQSLQMFLLISTAAFFSRGFDLYATLPEDVLQVLGCPPPPVLAHIALAGYIFTVLTPLVIHLLSGEKPVSHWRHLGYRAAFYCFYLFSNTLTANFTLVFTTGIVLYLLEQASVCISISRANDRDSQLA